MRLRDFRAGTLVYDSKYKELYLVEKVEFTLYKGWNGFEWRIPKLTIWNLKKQIRQGIDSSLALRHITLVVPYNELL